MSTEVTSPPPKRKSAKRKAPAPAKRRSSATRQGPSQTELGSRLRDISSIMTIMSDQRTSLNAATATPGTDMVAVMVGVYDPKTTPSGRTYTEFQAMVGRADPLRDDTVDDSGDLTLRGAYKTGKNDPNPIAQTLLIPFGTVQKIKVWTDYHGAAGDVVLIKGLYASYYLAKTAAQEMLHSLNCNSADPMAKGRFSIAHRIIQKANVRTKHFSKPKLIDDEAINYLIAKRQDSSLPPKAGVYKYGKTLVFQMKALTSDEQEALMVKPRAMMLGAQYSMGKQDDWSYQGQNKQKPAEVCMRSIMVYCGEWNGKDASAWNDRTESYLSVTCWAKQLAVFGLHPTDTYAWLSVIRHHLVLLQMITVGQVNLLDTAKNELNRCRILGTGEDKGWNDRLKFMHSVQANLLTFDASRDFMRIGIPVGFDWVVEHYTKNVGICNGTTLRSGQNSTKSPSAEVVCLDSYVGDLSALDKSTVAYVVLSSFTPESRAILPEFNEFIGKKMDQEARETLMTTLLFTQKDRLRKVKAEVPDVARFLDLTAAPADGIFRVLVFAIQGAKTKEGKAAQTNLAASIVDQFLKGSASTEDQATSRSGKRPRAAPSGDVHTP